MVAAELFVQTAASLTSLGSQWFYGSKRRLGPLMGIGAQVFWWTVVFQGHLWGLMPLNIAMAFIHIRNLILWRQQHSATIQEG